MRTGLDEFKSVLKEFRSVSIWAGISSVAVPFLAAFAGVIPPWPTGIEYITAVFQLLGIMFVYQMYGESAGAQVNRNIRILSIFAFVSFVVYLLAFSQFSIYIPSRNAYVMIGYACTTKAATVYGDACPFLNLDALKNSLYDEFDLWTKSSISIVRTALTALWFAFFISLSAFVGQFLIFQKTRRVTAKPI